MRYTFLEYQGDWEIKRMADSYYLENYFDFEIEDVEQDEMRTGIVTILLEGKQKPSVDYYDQEYDYQSVTEEVIQLLEKETFVEEVGLFLQTFLSVKEKRIGGENYIEKNRQGHHIAFSIQGLKNNFVATVKEQEVTCVKVNYVVGMDYILTDLFDVKQLAHYFTHDSKERIKLLY